MSKSELPTAVDKPLDTEPVVTAARPLGAFPDRYAPGDELGRGGMGRVVEAKDLMLGRTVALKEALDTDEETLRRFARETQITARLEHPSIVSVYDAGVSSEGSPFYVMRKVTGQPLSQLVADTATLDDRLALLPHVLAACHAVAHAHERGVIHRDLKPSNIIVGARGETTVIDWGLAKAIDETDPVRAPREPSAAESLRTQAGTVFGTPGFMSPEQRASSDVDERADVYALGATLFATLTAKQPADTPPPIATVVAGVPPELAAIVDKALAALPARYPDAGALAEDLSRFTTGQLVAAHAYTAREKLARFVRRYRALVLTIAGALLLLAIVSGIAVGRVLAARDEALDQAHAAERARAREADRASDLVISQAHLLLATNPTGAMAMVRPLAATKRWREVRAVAAGARAAGVATHLPGPAVVACVEMAPDGVHALACGSDGSIHVYDLVTRTHGIVATLAGTTHAVFVDDAHVLALAGTTLTLVDTQTKQTTVFHRATPIRRAAAHAGLVYTVDEAGHAARLDTATGAWLDIAIAGHVAFVAPSPDGKRVAFAGDNVWLADANHLELVEQIHAGKKFELSWDASGEHLATIGEAGIYDITVHPEIEVGEYGRTNQSAVLARGVMYSAGFSGLTVGVKSAGESDVESSMLGLWATKGEFVVGSARTALRIFDGTHQFRVPLPATPVTFLRASLHSPYILAVCAGHVLVWNIEQLVPMRVEVPAYTQFVAVGPDRVWTITSGGVARSVDTATGAIRELAKLPPLRQTAASSGAWVVARPLNGNDTWVIRPDGATEAVPVDAQIAVVLDAQHALIATKQHEVVSYDVASHTQHRLATYPAPIDRILAREAAPRWVVVVLATGAISRLDLTTGTATETRGDPRTEGYSPGYATSAAMADGTVFFARGASLQRWRTDGTVTGHVVVPRAIQQVFLIDDHHLFVVTDDGSAYNVATERAEYVRTPAIGATFNWGVLAPTLIATDDGTGGVTVLDLEVNAAWKIALATPAGSTPDITSDGSTVIMRDATLDATAIGLWRLDLPTTPAATARWIDEMTNATFDPRTSMIGWPP